MFKKILLPLDQRKTELEDRALDIALAEARNYGAEIYVLSVIPSFQSPWVASFFPDDAIDKASKEAALELRRYVEEKLPRDVSIHPRVAVGSPSEVILQQARDLGADLIIMPSRAHGIEQVFLGSCASRVVERAHCTVMVVKACE